MYIEGSEGILRVLFTSTLIIAATWKARANALSSAHIGFPDV